jgi:hypothetical protein
MAAEELREVKDDEEEEEDANDLEAERTKDVHSQREREKHPTCVGHGFQTEEKKEVYCKLIAWTMSLISVFISRVSETRHENSFSKSPS